MSDGGGRHAQCSPDTRPDLWCDGLVKSKSGHEVEQAADAIVCLKHAVAGAGVADM